MCFSSQPFPIHIFHAFFCLRAKIELFDFLYKGKGFNLNKKEFKAQIYKTTKCGQAHGALCAL